MAVFSKLPPENAEHYTFLYLKALWNNLTEIRELFRDLKDSSFRNSIKSLQQFDPSIYHRGITPSETMKKAILAKSLGYVAPTHQKKDQELKQSFPSIFGSWLPTVDESRRRKTRSKRASSVSTSQCSGDCCISRITSKYAKRRENNSVLAITAPLEDDLMIEHGSKRLFVYLMERWDLKTSSLCSAFSSHSSEIQALIDDLPDIVSNLHSCLNRICEYFVQEILSLDKASRYKHQDDLGSPSRASSSSDQSSSLIEQPHQSFFSNLPPYPIPGILPSFASELPNNRNMEKELHAVQRRLDHLISEIEQLSQTVSVLEEMESRRIPALTSDSWSQTAMKLLDLVPGSPPPIAAKLAERFGEAGITLRYLHWVARTSSWDTVVESLNVPAAGVQLLDALRLVLLSPAAHRIYLH